MDACQETAQEIRQLVHDLRTPLSVICMGLEVLKAVRHDEEQFSQLLQMMSAEGTQPLKALIAKLEKLPVESASSSIESEESRLASEPQWVPAADAAVSSSPA
jgi:K+-sensing histidine kinase KdpD